MGSQALKNPLNTIVRQADCLQARIELARSDSLEDRQSKLKIVQGVHQAVARMRELIDNILDYSKIGRETVVCEDIDLGAIVKQVLHNLEWAIQDVDMNVEMGNLPTLYGNRSYFVQLFQNLLENAIKHRGHEAPHVKISSTFDGEYYRVVLEDNGSGHSFSENDDTQSGVGVAICRKVVELHGGRFWIEAAKEGRGSRYCFTIEDDSAKAEVGDTALGAS